MISGGSNKFKILICIDFYFYVDKKSIGKNN